MKSPRILVILTHVGATPFAKIKMAMLLVCAKRAILAHHLTAGQSVKSIMIAPTNWHVLDKSVKILVLTFVVKMQNAM